MAIEITISSNIDDNLLTIQKRVRNIPSLLQQAGADVIEDSRELLLTSIDTQGKPFPPLRSGEARRPMLKTYRMFSSFQASVVGTSLTIRNTAPYSGFQNSLRQYISANRAQQIVFARLGQ